MTFALMLFWEGEGEVSAADLAALRPLLASVPGLAQALVYTPARARDQYNADEAAPALGLQLEFPRLEALEAASAAGGALQSLTVPSLKGARVTQQAMYVRTYSVDDPKVRGERPCSYVVHYPGPAADMNAWLGHYIAGHPPVMRKFPGIRHIEILTRVDWVTALPFTPVAHMQRNRVMFDSAEALEAALQSEVRHELRADFHTFPPFEGGNHHYAMLTELLQP